MAHEYDRLPDQKPIDLRLCSDFDFAKMRADIPDLSQSRRKRAEKVKPDVNTLIEQLAAPAAEGARGRGGVASLRAARTELTKRLAAMKLSEAERVAIILMFELRWSQLFAS